MVPAPGRGADEVREGQPHRRLLHKGLADEDVEERDILRELAWRVRPRAAVTQRGVEGAATRARELR
eukprot:5896294-Prymnesium_polylepis.1